MKIEGPQQGPRPNLKPKKKRRSSPSYYVDEYREEHPFLRYPDKKRVELAAQVRENKSKHIPFEDWNREQQEFAKWMELLGDDDQPSY